MPGIREEAGNTGDMAVVVKRESRYVEHEYGSDERKGGLIGGEPDSRIEE